MEVLLMATRATELYKTQILIEGYPNCRQANYRYLVLESEKEIIYSDRKVRIPCYGIEIIREDFKDDCIYSKESEKIECMTVYKHKVIKLLKKLYDNCVSPLHLIEIAGPIADEWVSDFDDLLSNIQAQ